MADRGNCMDRGRSKCMDSMDRGSCMVDWGNCIPSKLMGEKLFMLFSPFSVLLGVSEFFFCCSCFCMLAVSIPIFFTLS